jgi:alpha-L-fucosidase
MLNLSPMADGTFPDAQVRTLDAIGAWLAVNGEGIYSSHAWTQFAENGVHFTVRDGALYAFGSKPGQLKINAVSTSAGKVDKVELLGSTDPITFSQDASGLTVQVPGQQRGNLPFALKISGLNLK